MVTMTFLVFHQRSKRISATLSAFRAALLNIIGYIGVLVVYDPSGYDLTRSLMIWKNLSTTLWSALRNSTRQWVGYSFDQRLESLIQSLSTDVSEV